MAAAIAAPAALPQAALDLIRAGAPRSSVPPLPAESPPVDAVAPAQPEEREENNESAVEAPRPGSRRRVVEEPEEVIELLQDTYRLPKQQLATLARACFERKMKRVKPYTKQDIVSAALADWLKKHGFREEEAAAP